MRRLINVAAIQPHRPVLLILAVFSRYAEAIEWARESCPRGTAWEAVGWEDLANWPVLEKEPLRRHPAAFVADDCDRSRMFHEHTSGTSGKSLSL